MDKNMKGQKLVDGIRAQLKGRIKGRMRARKVVKTAGKLYLQNRMSRVLFKSSVLLTKFGTLGLKVHSSIIFKQNPRYTLLCVPVTRPI
jgi:ribosomal protein S3